MCMFLHVELTVHFLWLAGGLALLYYGAEWLVDGASAVALRFGISPLIVGLTVVAFGTSMPELLVCLKANSPELMAIPAAWFGFTMEAADPRPDIALGNIVGSNIFNIALILGVSAMIRPIIVHSQVIRRELPILIVSTLAFVGMMADMKLSRWEGFILAAGVVFYVVMSIRMARSEPDGEDEAGVDEGSVKSRLGIQFLLILVGIIALVIGADLLVENGKAIAYMFGVPEVIISLTLFALGTSLPELATTVVASLKGEGDIITGNAIGSCIFNLLAVMGVTAAVKPIIASNIAWMDLGVMLGLTVLILPFMWSRMRLNRLEGCILTAIAISYSVLVVVVQR